MTGPVTLPPLPRTARLRTADVVGAGLLGLRGRPLRAVLSALGIAIGIAAMVAVLGIGAASQARLLDRIAALGTNLLTVAPGQNLFGENVPLPDRSVDMVKRIGPVRSATATGGVPGATVRRTDRVDPRESKGIQVVAARLDLLGTLGGRPVAGTWLNDATARYPAVVLGASAARLLGIDGPGRQVFIAGQWFAVTGILAPLELAPEIDMSALVGWETARERLGFDGHPTRLYSRSVTESVGAVREVLARTVNPQDPGAVTVSRPSDALTAQLAAKNTFSGLLIGLGAVSLLVGGVGVANTMIISVLERRREIGLRRALGARRRQILLQFLTEAVALSALGGIAGAALGLAATVGYARYQGWPLVLPATGIAAGVVSSVVIGAVAGLYPALRAGRLPPTEALRG
ncbi:ABC transporter permease [Actinoplanes sp. NBRC 14428]|uniref:Putative ABC transport system permease protein n=1 Tax=Pseudosporangium ferrugineum TaxID=439699 RepID=A0A2T0SHP4_9ACTN|nr:ABC transporter permease [Pseudosporangium ferrugineum]PRY32938.1 putative ABC transport system permease protein [Pseudosporangium ferrugineum]BCJ49099.1 ABC transporter permease [Actinoplanes sp. NBRC 14428]